MIAASEYFAVPASADCRTAMPTSSLRFATITAQGANHLLGHILGGQRHGQRTWPRPAETDFTARWYTYRHPNCDYIDVIAELGDDVPEASWSITVQAGSGTAQVYNGTYSCADSLWAAIRAPWAVADSGYQPVVVRVADIPIRGMFSWDVPRESLGIGDHRIEHIDATYRAIGLGVDKCVAKSALAGPYAMVQEVIDAWDNYHPQVMSWWVASSAPFTTSSASFVGVFGDCTVTHQARAKTATNSTTDTKWYFYSWCDATAAYRVQVITGAETVTSGNLSNTSPGWQSLTGVACSNNSNDTIAVNVRRASGTGNIYVAAVSGIEE